MLSKRQINRIISKLIKDNRGCEYEREGYARALYLMRFEVNKKCKENKENEMIGTRCKKCGFLMFTKRNNPDVICSDCKEDEECKGSGDDNT